MEIDLFLSFYLNNEIVYGILYAEMGEVSMKQISITKISEEKNKKFIEIRYSGIPKDNALSLENAENLIEVFLDSNRYNDMVEIITNIRTILRNCDEKSLTILYQTENSSELIEYGDSSLLMYEKETKDRVKFKYEKDTGINVDLNDSKYDYATAEKLNNEIVKTFQYISSLKNVKNLTLDEDDKRLIKIYNLFYGENIDFASSDVEMKIQSMLSILAGFGIPLADDYAFNSSLSLEQKIKRLYPFGKVIDSIDDIKLDESFQNKIEIIGKYINNSIEDEPNKDEALINISKTIYANRYGANLEKSAESTTKLVKIIKNKIAQQKKSRN